jgi:hypothetical protein
MEPPTYIDNYEAVTNLFGYWPSFHDAKVPEYQGPTPKDHSIRITLHTWEMTNEVDAKGYYVLRNHALVTFLFEEVHDLEMDSFGSDNILFGMTFSREADSSLFYVVFDSVMCMPGSFAARSGRVVSG